MRILITGAARAIGAATAAELIRSGHEVVATARDVTLLDQLDVSQRLTLDVTDEESIRSALSRAGELDAIVNNAGVAVPGGVEEISEEDWDRVVAVNLKGVWAGMKYAIPHLRAAGGGSIVNMSSVQALVGFPGWAGYAATKGAIIALTQQAAVEYGPEKIRVNCLAPGTIMTPMNEQIFRTAPNPEALIANWNSSHALHRFGESTEVASAAAFLISDDASFVTGACLRVDGGLSVLGPTGRAT